MVVETKYSTKQEVFVWAYDMVCRSVIEYIVIGDGPIQYEVVGLGLFAEHNIYPTREELLKSMGG